MPYQTGRIDNSTELLEEIIAWLESLGWEQGANPGDIAPSQPTAAGYHIHISKNGLFVNLRSVVGSTGPWAGGHMSGTPAPALVSLHLYAGNEYNNGPKGNNATYNVGVAVQMQEGSINSYAFYSDAEDNICIVFEGKPGIISSIGWGRLNKTGIWTGGEYFFGPLTGADFATQAAANEPGKTMHGYCPATYGSSPRAFVRADVDAFVDKWFGIGAGTTAYLGYTGKTALSSVFYNNITLPAQAYDVAMYYGLKERATDQATLTATLLPIRLWVPRDAGGHSLLGDLPSIFFSSAANEPCNLQIGSVIKYGADEYVLYPNFAVKRVP